jgi:hypothetical protein
MVQDATLGLSKTDIGAMTSAFPAAYGEYGNLMAAAVSAVGMLQQTMGTWVLGRQLCRYTVQ